MPHRPVILGVVGDSAAGKTTLTAGIAAILGSERVAAFCTDDYHRYSRAERAARNLTPLHPDANNLDLLEEHLIELAEGRPVLKPVYDHHTGEPGPAEPFAPRQFIIVEGLLAFGTPSLRDCYHVRVYLDPEEELRRAWKLVRDCAERGYTLEQVLAEMERRQNDAQEFVRPQRGWADMVVRYYRPGRLNGPVPLNVQLILRPSLPYPDLGDVIARTPGEPVLRQRVGRDEGRLTEILEIDGRITTLQASAIQVALWDRMPGLQQLCPEQIGLYTSGNRLAQSHTLGLIQLLIAYHMLLARTEKERAAASGSVL